MTAREGEKISNLERSPGVLVTPGTVSFPSAVSMIHRTIRFTASGAKMKNLTTATMIIPCRNGVFFFFCALALRFPCVGHKPATSQPMRIEMAKRWQTKDAMVLPLMLYFISIGYHGRSSSLRNYSNGTGNNSSRPLQVGICSWRIASILVPYQESLGLVCSSEPLR